MRTMDTKATSASSPSPAPGPSPDAKAAHEFLVELTTRIATRRLPYRDGDEATALASLRKLFDVGRVVVTRHHGCHRAAAIISHILNDHVAPVTAEWHRKSLVGLLGSRDGGDAFREQLLRLQDDLRKEAALLAELTDAGDGTPRFPLGWDEEPPRQGAEDLPVLGEPLESGMAGDAWKASEDGKTTAAPIDVNAEEWNAIRGRRCLMGLPTAVTPRHDVFGLALSGGGIRSASFGLGVVQVLAERQLLKEVDYLSTVSGGGYTGSFVTRQLGCGPSVRGSAPSGGPRSAPGPDAMLALPNGPDTHAIRYLRLRARYLSGDDLKGRCLMACHWVAGTFLNWMAPLLALLLGPLLLALAGSVVEWTPSEWGGLGRAIVLAVAGGVGLVGWVGTAWYGVRMRFCREPASGGVKTWGVLFLGLCLVWMLMQADFWAGRLLQALTAWGQGDTRPVGTIWLASLALGAAWVAAGAWGGAWGRRMRGGVALGLAALLLPLVWVLSVHALVDWALQQPGPALASLAAASSFLVLGVFFALDVNRTSPRVLYQERLAETFIQRDADDASDLPLHLTNTTGRAPIHILNATLNVPASKQPGLRERGCDFFSLTRFFAGAPSVGYARAREWTSRREPVSLATAMAVSAAAASARMGLGSIPALAPLLAMLNVRLGYWIKKPWERGCTDVPGARALLREMFGMGMDEKARWLNLSDGGHIENMGAYELLRRRCKFIVCVDGEADPAFGFGGIMTLVRHARIDLGVEMLPHLDEIRPDPTTQWCRSHFALWTIRYPRRAGEQEDGLGFFLYLKLSVTGNEPELIRAYREAHPAFPHEPTSDQFFSEHQFEAYRSLGVHVAEMLFKDALMRLPAHANLHRPPDVSGVHDWFTRLATNLVPVNSRPIP